MGYMEHNTKLYGVPVPGIRTHGLHRTTQTVLCHPIHEIVRDAADNDRSMGLRLEEAIEDGKLPQPITRIQL